MTERAKIFAIWAGFGYLPFGVFYLVSREFLIAVLFLPYALFTALLGAMLLPRFKESGGVVIAEASFIGGVLPILIFAFLFFIPAFLERGEPGMAYPELLTVPGSVAAAIIGSRILRTSPATAHAAPNPR